MSPADQTKKRCAQAPAGEIVTGLLGIQCQPRDGAGLGRGLSKRQSNQREKTLDKTARMVTRQDDEGNEVDSPLMVLFGNCRVGTDAVKKYIAQAAQGRRCERHRQPRAGGAQENV